VSIFLTTGRVKAEWTDYNSHMNLAYYIHLFDVAWETLLEKFKEVDLNLMFLDHDKKRIIYKLEMIHKEQKYLAATSEILSLYVDLNHRKVTEFEIEKSDLMDSFIEKNKHDFNPGELHLIKKLKK